MTFRNQFDPPTAAAGEARHMPAGTFHGFPTPAAPVAGSGRAAAGPSQDASGKGGALIVLNASAGATRGGTIGAALTNNRGTATPAGVRPHSPPSGAARPTAMLPREGASRAFPASGN